MTQPQRPELKWTRITRDYVRLVDIMVDGVAVDPSELTAALLPAGNTPSASTTWLPTIPHPDDSIPSLRIAGPDADTTDAVVIEADSDVWGLVSSSGLTLPGKLGRINLR